MEHSRTIDLSTFASPFDNFFNYVPKEHETAVRHAVYNVLAFAALIVVVLGGYYVVVVLNPFIVPLIWGVPGSSACKSSLFLPRLDILKNIFLPVFGLFDCPFKVSNDTKKPGKMVGEPSTGPPSRDSCYTLTRRRSHHGSERP